MKYYRNQVYFSLNYRNTGRVYLIYYQKAYHIESGVLFYEILRMKISAPVNDETPVNETIVAHLYLH